MGIATPKSKTDLHQRFKEALISSETYRDFLGKAFEILRASDPRFSYAGFALRAGFSSRSYARDVILGQKRITARSLPKFTKALGLKGDLKRAFHLLVGLEESDALPDAKAPPQTRERILRLKTRLREEMSSDESPSQGTDLYRIRYALRVYSALGTEEGGATLNQVSKRSRLRNDVCALVVRELCDLGLARHDAKSGRYHPTRSLFVFEKLGGNQYFQESYVAALNEAARSARMKFETPDALYTTATWSIDRKSLPLLQQKVRDFITELVEQSETPEGDHVAQFTLALY